MGLAQATGVSMAVAFGVALDATNDRRQDQQLDDAIDVAELWQQQARTSERKIVQLRREHEGQLAELQERIVELERRDGQWRDYAAAMLNNIVEVENTLRRDSAETAGLEAVLKLLIKEVGEACDPASLSATDPAVRQRVFQEAWARFYNSNAFEHRLDPEVVDTSRSEPVYQPTLSKPHRA